MRIFRLILSVRPTDIKSCRIFLNIGCHCGGHNFWLKTGKRTVLIAESLWPLPHATVRHCKPWWYSILWICTMAMTRLVIYWYLSFQVAEYHCPCKHNDESDQCVAPWPCDCRRLASTAVPCQCWVLTRREMASVPGRYFLRSMKEEEVKGESQCLKAADDPLRHGTNAAVHELHLFR